MVTPHQTESVLLSQGDIESLQTIGSFCMETQRYLVVSFQENSSTRQLESSVEKQGNELGSQEDLEVASVLCQFKLPPSLGGRTLAVIQAPLSDQVETTTPKELLTQREFEIVKLVAQGWANKQIARLLKISPWTVSTHLRRIFLKLGVDTRAAMVYHCADFI